MKKKSAPNLEDDDEIIDLTEIIQPGTGEIEKESVHFEDLISQKSAGNDLDLDSLLDQLDDPNPEFSMPDSSAQSSSAQESDDDDLDALFNDAIKQKRAQFEADLNVEAPAEKPAAKAPEVKTAPPAENPEEDDDDLDDLFNMTSDADIVEEEITTDSDLDKELEALLSGTTPEPKEEPKNTPEEIDLDSLDDLLKKVMVAPEAEPVATSAPKTQEKAPEKRPEKAAPLKLEPTTPFDEFEEELLKSTSSQASKKVEEKTKPLVEDIKETKDTEKDNPFAEEAFSEEELIEEKPTKEFGEDILDKEESGEEESGEEELTSATKTKSSEPALDELNDLIDSLDMPQQPDSPASNLDDDEIDPAILEELDNLISSTILTAPIHPDDELLKEQFDIDLPPTDVLTVEEGAEAEELEKEEILTSPSEQGEVSKDISRIFEELHGISEELHSLKAYCEGRREEISSQPEAEEDTGLRKEIDNFVMDMTERFDDHARSLATFEGRLSQLESENEELRASLSLTQNPADDQLTLLTERLQTLEEATGYQELVEKNEALQSEFEDLSKKYAALQSAFDKAEEKLVQLDNLESLVAQAAAKVIREEITALLQEE